MAALNMDDPLEAIYAPCQSVYHRFPGLDGKLLLGRLIKTYAVHEGVTLHFFDDQNCRALQRHPPNNRKQEVVESDYAAKILDKGIVEGVRGAPWCTYAPNRKGPYQMITFGTLSSAFYRAYDKEPYNRNILATLANGLPSATIFHERTPSDVITYLKEEHNSYHTGSRTSFMEVCQKIPQVEAQWRTHCLTNHISVRGGRGDASYDKLYSQWVAENHGKDFKTWQIYDCAKSFVHNINKVDGLWAQLEGIFGSRVDYANPKLDTQTAIQNLHALTVLFDRNFSGIYEDSLVRKVLLVALQFVVPRGVECQTGLKPLVPATSKAISRALG